MKYNSWNTIENIIWITGFIICGCGLIYSSTPKIKEMISSYNHIDKNKVEQPQPNKEDTKTFNIDNESITITITKESIK